MALLLVGLNHKTAPIELREKVSMSPEDVPELLAAFRRCEGVGECAILSTCNRTELYAVTEADALTCGQGIQRFLAQARHLDGIQLDTHLYQHQDQPAINHLFSVSSGLDSLILGENQILGQVRKAYVAAKEARVTGPFLDRLFPWALRVGKRARSQTRICQGASSVSAAAVELAQKIFGDLKGRRLMLLGAGKMTRKALKLLLAAGVERVKVVNRTFSRASEMAEQCGGEAVPFEDLDKALSEVDVLISSTGAPHYVVTKERMTQVMRARRGRPVFLVDIAVPRDFDPACGELDNVYLYNIDDLQSAVDQNLARRHDEVKQVLAIIESETEEFFRYVEGRQVSSAIVHLRSGFDTIRERELERFSKKHKLSPEQAALVEKFSQSLVNKLLHQPTQRLKQLGGGGASPEELTRSLEILGLSGHEELE